MPRTAQINFKRITFSFPEKVVDDLREKVGNNNMSKYVADLISEDLIVKSDDVDSFIDSLKESRLESSKNSLTTLREIRYGK